LTHFETVNRLAERSSALAGGGGPPIVKIRRIGILYVLVSRGLSTCCFDLG